MINLSKKSFAEPDELKTPPKTNAAVVKLGNVTASKLTLEPGWKWSKQVSPLSGTKFCEVEHLGMVLSGSATAAFENGDVHTMNKGDLFYISPEPHDSWVVGEDDYISLHFIGAEKYAD